MSLSDFTDAYIECALWSSTDDNGNPLEDHEGELSDETRAQMETDCEAFYLDNEEDLEESGLSDERAGHDFWLTRNRHGAGFWDDGNGEVFQRLTANSHAYGSIDLYVGDAGEIHS